MECIPEKHPEDANLTEEALHNMLNDKGEELEKIIRRMQKFNSNIIGSNLYFYKKHKELEVLIEQEGLCTIQFILSVVDNYWLDLNKIIHSDRPLPNFSNKDKKAKQHRKLVKDNLHIVDSYFMDRTKAFI